MLNENTNQTPPALLERQCRPVPRPIAEGGELRVGCTPPEFPRTLRDLRLSRVSLALLRYCFVLNMFYIARI